MTSAPVKMKIETTAFQTSKGKIIKTTYIRELERAKLRFPYASILQQGGSFLKRSNGLYIKLILKRKKGNLHQSPRLRKYTIKICEKGIKQPGRCPSRRDHSSGNQPFKVKPSDHQSSHIIVFQLCSMKTPSLQQIATPLCKVSQTKRI